MFTLEEVNWDDNLFRLSTTLLSKHYLDNLHQYTLPKINNFKILTYIQAQGHDWDPPSLPLEKIVGIQANTHIQKKK